MQRADVTQGVEILHQVGVPAATGFRWTASLGLLYERLSGRGWWATREQFARSLDEEDWDADTKLYVPEGLFTAGQLRPEGHTSCARRAVGAWCARDVVFRPAGRGDKKRVSMPAAIREPPAPVGEGTVLGGRYRLRDLLGRGGMADVYVAEDDVLGRPVAVKVFHSGPGSLGEPERQRQEARLLASLNHPGLVTVFDAGVDADRQRTFLVMEIVRGPTLAARLADGPLRESEVRQVGACLAEALAYVHAHGVVHRDVKPGNVLFTDPDDCHGTKLADFGIARMAGSAGHTEAGLVVGSARYVSPEQALGAGVGPPSDVYALGLVLLECLTGAPAYAGAGIAAMVARLHRDPDVPDSVDPALGQLIRAMTSREPAARPTAHDVAAILRGSPSTQLLPPVEPLGGADSATGQQLKAIRARIGRVHAWAWVAAACAAGIVALAGAAALLEESSISAETAEVAPPPTPSLDAAQVPPAPPNPTPSAGAQPAVQTDVAAAQITKNPHAEEGQEEANNQVNGKDKDKDKDKQKDKAKDERKAKDEGKLR